ncbi:MAG TPA: FHA domain-containing protein [Bdellovibrionales bacterium]|nr:FHA domain-containing protein [Bdellovibrionales bacterium]
MWIVRFLNGPLAGQIVPLKKSSTLVGRAPNCDIKVTSGNVSKEHTRLEVFDDKLIISDAGSRNGTFLNGVQIRSSKAKSGDKVSLHDILFEVQQVPDAWAPPLNKPYPVSGAPPAAPAYHGNAAYQTPGLPSAEPQRQYHAETDHAPHLQMADGSSPMQDLMAGHFPRLATVFEAYMDRVVLPGLYRLPEMFEFKWVLAGFMGAFIISVTALSMIPLTQILRASIEEESQQHALTIATTLAKVNRPYLMQGLETSVSVDVATSRPGVKKAFIINNLDGNIVAPAAQAGSFPDIAYVHEGRKSNKEAVYQIDGSTVVALYPIEFYNSEVGNHAITHWAVVLYDMSSLAVDNGRVLSLFITTLFIALLFGGALFYFLYKVVEYPVRSMNSQLDTALKEGHDTIQVTYNFPAMQLLASNISSALTRTAGSGDQNAHRAIEHDRNREIANLVELIGFAALGVRAVDLSIAAANQAFEARNGGGQSLTTITVNELNDQALKLSIKDLIERVDRAPDDLASNNLEFSGSSFQVVAQAVHGTSKIAYYLIVLLPQGGEG